MGCCLEMTGPERISAGAAIPRPGFQQSRGREVDVLWTFHDHDCQYVQSIISTIPVTKAAEATLCGAQSEAMSRWSVGILSVGK